MTDTDDIGGFVWRAEPFLVLADNGLKTEYKYTARSSHTGETVTFWSRNAALHWVWLINERVQAKAYREANQA